MNGPAGEPASLKTDGCPHRMPAEALHLRCVHCGGAIRPGELFLTAGRCSMGGVVTGPSAALYSDILEPEGEHVRCAAAQRGAPDARCCTIGHGTQSLEEFLSLLRVQEIALVADIRTVPGSRHNPQFGGAALARSLPEAGLCYLHLKELGGLRRPRADSPNGGWRNESFRGYADYTLTPEFDAAVVELISLLRVERTAIMCAETVYWRCHRSLVADALTLRGVETLHLIPPVKTVAHTLTRFARPDGERLLYPAEE